jgi:RNA-directed DNA polymerase
MASVARYLEKKLRLRVNRDKSAVAHPEQRKFLGYRVLGREKARLGIAPKSLQRAKKAIRRITKRNRGVSLGRVLEELRCFTDGWVAYYWRARTPSVFQELDQWIRRRLRCYQWKLWKSRGNRARQMMKAGVGPKLAWGVVRHNHGPWHTAGCPAMSRTLTNAKLKAMGFHSLHERYLTLAAA